jgi:hypothetical protein
MSGAVWHMSPGGMLMANNVGRLTIVSIVAVLAIVVVALMLANR